LYQFGGAVGCESTGYPNWNSSTNVCYAPGNVSNTTAVGGNGYTNTNYMLTQLGTTGLAGWVPAIIAFSVGMLFLGAFFIKGGRRY